jgi:hypothetical protein
VLAVVLLLFGAPLMGFGHLRWYIHVDLTVTALGTALAMVMAGDVRPLFDAHVVCARKVGIMMMSVDTRIDSLALAESVFIISLVFSLVLYVCLSLPNKLYAWAEQYHARRIMWLVCGVLALLLIILNAIVFAQNIEAVLACRGRDSCFDVCAPTTCKRAQVVC